jgi:hypothetical protein
LLLLPNSRGAYFQSVRAGKQLMHTGKLCKNQVCTTADAMSFSTTELELSVRIPANMILEMNKRCLILLVPPIYIPSRDLFLQNTKSCLLCTVFALKPLKIKVHKTANSSLFCVGAKPSLLPYWKKVD